MSLALRPIGEKEMYQTLSLELNFISKKEISFTAKNKTNPQAFVVVT